MTEHNRNPTNLLESPVWLHKLMMVVELVQTLCYIKCIFWGKLFTFRKLCCIFHYVMQGLHTSESHKLIHNKHL